MKTKNLFIIAAALAVAACSSDDSIIDEKQVQQPAGDVPVAFTAYVNRGTTRAGYAGAEIANAGAPTAFSLSTVGFGVFAYYTDNQPYSQSATPNFMYNQKVSGSGWTYEPVKYWPNEFGGTAISDGEDRLTFFAYAPYVDVYPGTGRINEAANTNNSLTSGIVGLTSNIATGDPYVKYYADMNPAKCVDLCWGVAKEAFTSTVDGATANNIAAEAPYIDVIKPETGSKINFDFKHALASLNVTIDADVDAANHGHANDVAANTKIYVRSVTFEGFATKGLLNLNADATNGPLWYELSSTNTKLGSGVTTIYDGRRDGKEGQANAAATNESPADLNAAIIQTEVATEGVTKTAVNLFKGTSTTAPVFVIPTDEPLSVTIVYDVETEDPNVAGYLSDGKTHGSTIENKITKEISWATAGTTGAMEAGKKYTVKLHLGMTSVKFDASVTPWETGDEADPDLPINKD